MDHMYMKLKKIIMGQVFSLYTMMGDMGSMVHMKEHQKHFKMLLLILSVVAQILLENQEFRIKGRIFILCLDQSVNLF